MSSRSETQGSAFSTFDHDEIQVGAVQITVVVPVRDRWCELEECLDSLSRQEHAPGFEVVVVDDGSQLDPPRSLARWQGPLRLRLLRQESRGIGAARNAGVRVARGDLCFFLDSDCLAEPEVLRALCDAAKRFPDDIGFQARLRGWSGDVVGRMEGLRLEAIQEATRRSDGHIVYLNTSGFALRAAFIGDNQKLFDESVRRGTDSLHFTAGHRGSSPSSTGRIDAIEGAPLVRSQPAFSASKKSAPPRWAAMAARPDPTAAPTRKRLSVCIGGKPNRPRNGPAVTQQVR